jgi:hypothetical protein
LENIKLEAGKFYRTQDGRKAFVGASKLTEFQGISEKCTFVGYVDGQDSGVVWNDGGVAISGYSNLTIEAEWVEPKRIKVIVNIFPSNDIDYPTGYRVGAATHATKEDAQRYAQGMVATIEIDVLEGQGLDGSTR